MKRQLNPVSLGSVFGLPAASVALAQGASAPAASGTSLSVIAAAASVTVLDGFDAFTLSLTAPRLSAELHIPTASLGGIFAFAMGGMIIGAFGGGAAADRFGRLRVLLLALAAFGLAALTMPLVTTAGGIIVNRVLAGVGLGAAAPIAIALLSRSSDKPPSQLVLVSVWSGIAVGGILAALFNYLFVAALGWRSMFLAGGVLPLAAAAFSYAVFRHHDAAASTPAAKRAPMTRLFAAGEAPRTIATALMFFFGFITSSIIINWLPTILSHRHASPLMVSASFAGVSGGGIATTFLLGLVSPHQKSRLMLTGAWAAAGLCSAAAALPAIGILPISLLAIAGSAMAVAGIALSVAFASQLHRAHGLESTTIGFMNGAGRIGQFGALNLTGIVIAAGVPETDLFALGGGCAGLAALIALLFLRAPPAAPDAPST